MDETKLHRDEPNCRWLSCYWHNAGRRRHEQNPCTPAQPERCWFCRVPESEADRKRRLAVEWDALVG